MRNALLATAATCLGLAFGRGAEAAMLVYDSNNFANTLQEVRTAAKQLTQLQAQLAQLQQTYQMFTNPTNIAAMLPALSAPTEQNPMPAASALPGQIGGSAGLSGLAQQFFSLNHVFTATGGDAQASLLNRSAVAIANIEALAQGNLQSIETRQASLNAMLTELQNATDIKQVEAINGRLAIESNAIQGQQAQAANLQALVGAQAQAAQQAALEATRQAHEQAAALFTATLD
jgi:type IV secretion system protein VirB5